ncbi:hypothetical protein BD324DRAFT_651355 [Kockovaella imperatae]|uniref:Uncharacterized protein n=1 Tax=Kockovaella imperatae TaxID=4999 RepID=A0A1Y1UFS2_9TREE|nr:hypothetical protein BD324DRAFT_651355 [Kockovaella imperatae]ORX36878.1 hypothetical protein BD324DRAFT_651355 [Kockovaella imperatae]
MDSSYARQQSAHHRSQLTTLLSTFPSSAPPHTTQSQMFQVPRVNTGSSLNTTLGTSLDGRSLSTHIATTNPTSSSPSSSSSPFGPSARSDRPNRSSGQQQTKVSRDTPDSPPSTHVAANELSLSTQGISPTCGNAFSIATEPGSAITSGSQSLSGSLTGTTIDTPIPSPAPRLPTPLHKSPIDFIDSLNMGLKGSPDYPLPSQSYGGSVDANGVFNDAYTMLSQWTPGYGFGSLAVPPHGHAPQNTFAFVADSLNMNRTNE